MGCYVKSSNLRDSSVVLHALYLVLVSNVAILIYGITCCEGDLIAIVAEKHPYICNFLPIFFCSKSIPRFLEFDLVTLATKIAHNHKTFINKSP